MAEEVYAIDFVELKKQIGTTNNSSEDEKNKEILRLQQELMEAQENLLKLQKEVILTSRKLDRETLLDKELKKEERLRKQKEKEERLLAGVSSTGKPLATPSEAIDSYDEFVKIDNILRSYGKSGSKYALCWELGVAIGLRISDIIQFKWIHFFDSDCNFRERIYKVEQKTSKTNNILITEFVKNALLTYIEESGIGFITQDILNENIFGNNRIDFNPDSYCDYISTKIKKAAKEAGCKGKISSHGMRKTFVKIIECYYDAKQTSQNLAIIQLALNHADIRTTYKYLGWEKDELDSARECVSDFLLGKLGNELKRK